MARQKPGPIGDLFDLKGRRQARQALTRAWPELGDRERDVLLQRVRAWDRRRSRWQQRTHGLSPVDFCRGLTFEGWEHLHNATPEAFFLLAPLGSLEVANRVLDLYHQNREHAVMIPAPKGPETVTVNLLRRPVRCAASPARQALTTGKPAIWMLAIPDGKNRWTAHFQPPIPPLANETPLSLSQRYFDVLDEAIRRHPEYWPWRELG